MSDYGDQRNNRDGTIGLQASTKSAPTRGNAISRSLFNIVPPEAADQAHSQAKSVSSRSRRALRAITLRIARATYSRVRPLAGPVARRTRSFFAASILKELEHVSVLHERISGLELNQQRLSTKIERLTSENRRQFVTIRALLEESSGSTSRDTPR